MLHPTIPYEAWLKTTSLCVGIITLTWPNFILLKSFLPCQHSKQCQKKSRRSKRPDTVQVSVIETFFHASSFRDLVSKFSLRDLNEISQLVHGPLKDRGSGQEDLCSVERRNQSDPAHTLRCRILRSLFKLEEKSRTFHKTRSVDKGTLKILQVNLKIQGRSKPRIYCNFF